MMLYTKTNASVLAAGTQRPYNPLKLQKTLFFENFVVFYVLFIKVCKVT